MPKTLFGDLDLSLPNVAAVPQYSPFRYPGGKSRWYEFVKRWVLHTRPEVFVEPFAGGAHAGLAVAIEGLADQVVLVELDDNVAAVWHTIIHGNVDWLMQRITDFEMTHEAADDALDRKDQSTRDRAFAMIVHNRISRGGITAPGAGRLNKGENGKGIRSRWYPDTLVERIDQIRQVAHRIEFIHGDGLSVAARYSGNAAASFFIDPPYPIAGRRLYEHSDVDHRQVFELATAVQGHVLLTYDDSDEVEDLVAAFNLSSAELVVSTTHHRTKKELLISDDLGWLY